MQILFKYLKRFTLTISVALALLFAQAIMELELPSYMANIVNVGIQQNGIEHATPTAISENAFNMINYFADENKQLILKDSFELIEKDDNNYIDEYPLLSETNIYLLIDKNNYQQLDTIFSESIWNLFNSLAIMSDGNQTTDLDNTEIDFDQLYQIIPFIDVSVVEHARNKTNAMDEMLLEQTAVAMVSSYYEELGINTQNIQRNYIYQTGMWMLLFSLLAGLASIAVSYLAAKIGSKVVKNMRHDIFNKVVSFSKDEFDKFSTASLITRTTNDLNHIRDLVVMGITMLCYAPILGIGGMIMILRRNSSMVWIIILAIILILIVIFIVVGFALPKFKVFQNQIDKINMIVRENLTGLLVVRAFSNQKFEEKRFKKANLDLANTNLFIGNIMITVFPLVTLIMNGISVLIVWIGAHQIAQSNMAIGDMMAFIQYAMQVIMSFLLMAMIFFILPRALVSLKRIKEVLTTEIKVNDPVNPKDFDSNQIGYVEFKNVDFSYPNADEKVLENISFVASPQKTTAFIGSTGSGKSTLISLIPRLYDVTNGEVLVNGVNVKDVKQNVLQEQIGFVPQKGILLSGSIASNIKYGDENIDDKTMIDAATTAQAIEFIEQKELKFGDSIGQGGSNVSGGQRQRLSIARALAKKAPIYIFDDSFSALDFKTDAKLRAALKEYSKKSTLLIVAQRINTIMDADQIIVLDQGKIVGIGTHKELLKNCSAYYEIAASQLSEKELNYGK